MKTRLNTVFYTALSLIFSSLLFSCQDDLSSQGSSLVKGEVSIIVDSIPTAIKAESVDYNAYDARSTTKLLGRVKVPEYGSLSCTFLSQLYPSPTLGISDTVPEAYIDSIKLLLQVPRKSFTGDANTPQQVKIYRLNNQLPADITNNADPSAYCNTSDPAALIGSSTYTLSGLNLTDTAYKNNTSVFIRVPFPREEALRLVRQYRTNPAIFQWPQTFAQTFPGIYVEQTFGNGCIGNIDQLGIFLYYRVDKKESVKDPETNEMTTTTVIKRDSVCVFTGTPEVISSNVIKLNLSDKLKDMAASGKSIITTPGGYLTDITFPAKEILERYNQNSSRLTVVSSLSMEIPAEEIKNDYGIGVAPYLLMVKKADREKFFQNNSLPDEVTTFTAPYNVAKKSYSFTTLRTYILSLIEKGEITPEDTEFSLVPVDITSENVTNYDNTITTYVTRCANYISKPTMTLLDTENTIINFTYTKQEIE